MWCLLRLDLAVIVNQFFCFVPRVQKIFALVEYLRVIFLPTLYPASRHFLLDSAHVSPLGEENARFGVEASATQVVPVSAEQLTARPASSGRWGASGAAQLGPCQVAK